MNNDDFLKALAQIESNGGKNFNHPLINHGINKGIHAIGTYGLTPATVDDVIKNNPEYSNLLTMNPAEKKQYLESNPNVEKSVANQLVNQLSNRYQNNPEQMAYAWNHGTYLNPNKITPEILQNDQYTNKFNNLTKKLGSNNESEANIVPQNENLLKKVDKKLPTSIVASLDDIINDPRNPFLNEEDEDQNILF